MVHIDSSVSAKITEEALRTFPDECCGFLFGSEEQDVRVIDDFVTVNNAKEGDKRRRFAITPADYLQAERYAEENERTLLGVYHSHPDHPAVPSEHDRVVAQPFFSYIIIAVRKETFVALRSWQLNDDFQFEEEEVLITDTIHSI